eukprot:GHVT01087386.1.p1 GENE.GHVT01087386.1~~GHVT01087386.1.p1  ORF type:complete len:304 (+),score=37.38 GHVT01087386.1:1053-1964(+)
MEHDEDNDNFDSEKEHMGSTESSVKNENGRKKGNYKLEGGQNSPLDDDDDLHEETLYVDVDDLLTDSGEVPETDDSTAEGSVGQIGDQRLVGASFGSISLPAASPEKTCIVLTHVSLQLFRRSNLSSILLSADDDDIVARYLGDESQETASQGRDDLQKGRHRRGGAKRGGRRVGLDNRSRGGSTALWRIRESERRPDILHECLLNILDSPLCKAGGISCILLETHPEKKVIAVSPQFRVPRTWKVFAKVMTDFITSPNGKLAAAAASRDELDGADPQAPQVLMQLLEPALHQYLPARRRYEH